MARTAWIVGLLLLLVATAGCVGGDSDDDGDDGTTTATTTAGGGDGGDGGDGGGGGDGGDGGDNGDRGDGRGGDNTTQDHEATIHTFEANQTSGTAPLAVAFDLDAESSDGDATWRLAFGDGADTSGAVSDLPAEESYTYEVGGNFTAVFELEYGDGQSVNETIEMTVQTPDDGGGAPPDFYDFGPSAGCVGDVTGTCVSLEAGPGEEPVDGFWIPLDERYVGVSFTSTVDNARSDSDAWFLDAELAIITDANGGGTEATGTVPPGAAWLFIYSYAEPAPAMTVTFEF